MTPQSLVSFAGATGAVTLIWQGLGTIRPAWRTDPTVALIVSAIVGVVIYLISETDPKRGPVTARERIIGIVIAAINSFVIFSASVGAIDVSGQTG